MVPKHCSTRKRRFEISLLKRFSEARRGSPRTALRPHLAHDPVAVTAAKHVAVRFAGVSLVCQDTLRFGSINHGRKLRAFAPVGRCCVNLGDKALFVGAGKALVTRSAL